MVPFTGKWLVFNVCVSANKLSESTEVPPGTNWGRRVLGGRRNKTDSCPYQAPLPAPSKPSEGAQGAWPHLRALGQQGLEGGPALRADHLPQLARQHRTWVPGALGRGCLSEGSWTSPADPHFSPVVLAREAVSRGMDSHGAASGLKLGGQL